MNGKRFKKKNASAPLGYVKIVDGPPYEKFYMKISYSLSRVKEIIMVLRSVP